MKRDVDDRLRRLVAEVTREVAAESATVAKGSPPSLSPPSSTSPSSSAAQTLARAEICASCAEEARQRGPRAVVTTTGKNAAAGLSADTSPHADEGFP